MPVGRSGGPSTTSAIRRQLTNGSVCKPNGLSDNSVYEQWVCEYMKSFSSMAEYYDHLARSGDPHDDIEYAALRHARDPVNAFDLFVKRNVHPSRQAQFADGSNVEADLVRRAIQSAREP